MSRARTLLIGVTRPVTIWALHFLSVYALISLACSPRMMLDPLTMRLSVGVLSLATAVLLLAWMVTGVRTMRDRALEPHEHQLATAAFFSVLISLGAVLFNLIPVIAFSTCTGSA